MFGQRLWLEGDTHKLQRTIRGRRLCDLQKRGPGGGICNWRKKEVIQRVIATSISDAREA